MTDEFGTSQVPISGQFANFSGKECGIIREYTKNYLEECFSLDGLKIGLERTITEDQAWIAVNDENGEMIEFWDLEDVS